MKRSLVGERVMMVIEASMGKVNDYDQRSALGMARAFLRNGKPMARMVEKMYAGRDDLAEALVEAIRGADRVEAIGALASARRWVNAPFEDPSMAGFRARRLAVGMVGSEKKTEKMAG